MIFVNILPVIIFYICLVSQHSNANQYEGDSNVESGKKLKKTYIVYFTYTVIYRDSTVIAPIFSPNESESLVDYKFYSK
jgi:hypothetical protein